MALTQPKSSEYISVEGIRTFFVRQGSGPAVILLHGASPGASSRVNWAPTIDGLASTGFTVYAFDQPGFGFSDNPLDYSMEFRVAHAVAFVSGLDLESYSLIGNSMGGYIATRLAIEEQQRTRRLVIVASGGLGPRSSPESEAASRIHSDELRDYSPSLENMRTLSLGTLFNPALVTDEFLRERYEMSVGKNYDAQKGRAAAPPLRVLTDELRDLAVRTMVVWGANDRGSSLEKALLLFKQIPGAEMHVFDRCGHWPQWDHADRFNTLVRDFLRAA